MDAETRRHIGIGVPGLDSLLRGGLPPGHLYLVDGPSGSGKTTLALQFLREGARQGERVLYFGTSESEEEIREVAETHGWDLAGVDVRHHGTPRDSGGGSEQTMLHPIEVELPRVMEELLRIVDEVRPSRFALDSLSEIRLLSRDESWFRDQVKMLQQHVAGRDCTVLVTDASVGAQPVLRSAVHGVIEIDQLPSVYGSDRRRLRVAKMRGVDHATGYHDIEVETGGLRVYPRLVAAEHRDGRELESASSGLPKLDAMLGGGLDRGGMTLFLGSTGTGKSSLVTQCAVAAARRGERAAMYVFDERVETVFHRAEGLGLELRDHVESGLVTVRQVDPVELTPGQFTEAVVQEVDAGARLLVIDSLNGYSYAMPEERVLGLHLHELVSYLNQKGVTSLHVMTLHGLHAPQRPEFDVSYIADTVVVLQPFERDGVACNAVAVHKRRVGPHERSARELSMNGGRITIGEPLNDYAGIIFGRLQHVGAPVDGSEGAR